MNSAAWVMRHTPLFLLPGSGRGRFQPVHVRDMADLMYDIGAAEGSEEADACGPDGLTALELFGGLKGAVGAPGLVAAPGVSPRVVTALTKPINWLTGDILLDGDDLDLMESGVTVADVPDDPRIATRRSLFKWMGEQGKELGKNYVSSTKRYYQKDERLKMIRADD